MTDGDQPQQLPAVSSTAPPQYSPDGYWWWNGYQWVPTRPQMQPMAGVYWPQQSSSFSKGCLIAAGAGLALVGLLCMFTLLFFIPGVIILVAGIGCFVFAAAMR